MYKERGVFGKMGEQNSVFAVQQDHEKRIKTLEENFATFTSTMTTEIGSLKNGQLQTHNTLLTSKQEQDKLLQQIVTQNGEIVKHTLDIKKVGNEGKWKAVGIGVGSGGIGIVAIVGLIELFQRLAG